jgi:hypothetical protein
MPKLSRVRFLDLAGVANNKHISAEILLTIFFFPSPHMDEYINMIQSMNKLGSPQMGIGLHDT